MSDQLIISIAVFSHGMEDLNHPFDETSEVGTFYKQKVRVYSQSCVPDIPSLTASHTHAKTARTLVKTFQDNKSKHAPTSTTLMPIMKTMKDEYQAKMISHSTKATHPTYDQRAFDKEYIEKSCGIMTYLANKTFAFSKDYDQERSLEGMVVLDVRVKRTKPDGTETYERIMDVDERNRNHIDITTYDGLSFLLTMLLSKKLLKVSTPSNTPSKTKKKTTVRNNVNNIIEEIASEVFTMPKFKSGSKITEIDLHQLHKIFKKLNVEYVNMVDYSCRSCNTRLPKKQIDTMYNKEQETALLLPNFGGRTMQNRKTRKTGKPGKRLYK